MLENIIRNFSRPKVSPSGKLYICSAPSILEIETLDKHTYLTIQVTWPTGEPYKYRVDETTTIESLLTEKVWKEPYFSTERDCNCYWLFLGGDKQDRWVSLAPERV